MYGGMHTPSKTPAIRAARLIVAGDIDAAARILLHTYAQPMSALQVCEARAVAGACYYARRTYPGCHVSLAGLVWGAPAY